MKQLQRYGISIEKNIPFPKIRRLHGKWIDIYEAMNPGDSITLNKKEAMVMRSAVTRKSVKGRIRSAAIDKTKVRVWRV